MKNSLLFYKLLIFNIILIKTQLISGLNIKLQYGNSLQEEPFHVRCPNGTKSQHPFKGDCLKYIECFDGQLFEKSCAPGTAFDKNRLLCDYKYKVECDYWNTTNYYISQIVLDTIDHTACPQTEIGLFPHPFHNSYYLNCVPPYTFLQKCPYGTAGGKCLPVHTPQTGNSDNNDIYTNLYRCPSEDNSKLYYYPFTPRKYIQCTLGQIKVLECGPSEVFSISKSACLPEVQVPHGDHVAMPTTKPIPSNDNVKYNDTIDCPLELFGLYPHPFNNQKYLKCVHGRLYEKPCAKDYVYNIFTKFCEQNEAILYQSLPPAGDNHNDKSKAETENGSTFLKCPEKLVGTFIHPFECYKYINCSPAGTRIGSCPNGKVYSFRKGECDYESEMKVRDHVKCIRNNRKDNSEDTNGFGINCKPGGRKNYPHPTNLYKFVRCLDGKLQVNWCKKNKYFDLETRECIDESNEIEE